MFQTTHLGPLFPSPFEVRFLTTSVPLAKVPKFTHIHFPYSLLSSAHPVPSHSFCHIHVDLLDPLPVLKIAHTFSQLLTTTHDGRNPSLFPPSLQQPALCLPGFPFLGFLHTIKSNCGSQFIASLWAQLSFLLNISHIITTSW